MGMIQAEITLKNTFDVGAAERGYIRPEEVRTVTVTAVVDTGAMFVVINEDLQQKLGLTKVEDGTAHIANGESVKCEITHPVDVHWKNRQTSVRTIVMPGAKKVLLGALALEAMDLIIDPKKQEIVGAHGDRLEFLAL